MESSSEENLAELLTLRKEVDIDGNIRYYNKDNQLHRIHGPAVIDTDGSKLWYINDENHREDGPAGEYSNGDKEWRLNDLLHREDGPAIEWANGDKEWWLNGERHREDGPAIIYDNSNSWYKYGKHIRSESSGTADTTSAN